MGILKNLLEVQAQSKGSEEAYKAPRCFLVTPKYLNSSGRISKDKEKKLRTRPTTKMPGGSSTVALCKGRLTLAFLLSKNSSQEACHRGWVGGEAFSKKPPNMSPFAYRTNCWRTARGLHLLCFLQERTGRGCGGLLRPSEGCQQRPPREACGSHVPRELSSFLLVHRPERGPPS